MRKLIIAAAIASLTACSSTEENVTPSADVSNTMYLRGDFNLWEAQPEYELAVVSNAILQTKVKFLETGKAYEFKISDEKWTMGLNCGYKDEGLDKFLELGIPVQANCNSIYNYFSFTPYEAGWYQVSINFKLKDKPLITINQIFE